MAVIHLNKKALEQAERLIKAGEIETFDSNWEAEKPDINEVDAYLNSHNLDEYGSWFLGLNPEIKQEVKERYEYPYGDLKTVQRSALVDTIARAQKANHKDIAQVAQRLLEMVDKLIKK